MLLAYHIESEKVFYTLNGQFREAGSDKLILKLDLKPRSVLHLYFAFIAADRSRQSDSLYIGELKI